MTTQDAITYGPSFRQWKGQDGRTRWATSQAEADNIYRDELQEAYELGYAAGFNGEAYPAEFTNHYGADHKERYGMGFHRGRCTANKED